MLLGVGHFLQTDDRRFKGFMTGAQFSSWLGLVPRQNSSGGDLRTLLIQGAKSAVMTAHQRTDKISQWLVQWLARVGWQKAVVALANKNTGKSLQRG